MKKRITPTLAICLAAGLAAGIALARPGDSGSANGSSAEPTSPRSTVVPGASEPIEIVNFSFNSTVVEPGSVVEVRNVDDVEHTVTADDGSFDTGTIRGKGAATFVAQSIPGTYTFICSIHPSMTGELIVR